MIPSSLSYSQIFTLRWIRALMAQYLLKSISKTKPATKFSTLKFLWKHTISLAFIVVAISLITSIFLSQPSQPYDSNSDFVGSEKCGACHGKITASQLNSDHAHTMVRVHELTDLMNSLPIEYFDETSGTKYRLEKSNSQLSKVDLIASRGSVVERLELLWGLGAGRKGITFVGKSEKGDFGQSRVSWYQKINKLDITTGLEKKPVDVYDALASWMNPAETEHCLKCHMTRNTNHSPETIKVADAGVNCERCHGPGQQHIQRMTQGQKNPSGTIKSPGNLGSLEQVYFCGTCHGIPPGGADLRALDHAMAQKHSVRFPAKRLVLSRCYNESGGKLKCTTCHNVHENLPLSFDQNCLSCHSGKDSLASPCPQSTNDCVRCHMPQETGFMTHSEFADHWIRIVSPPENH